MSSKDLNGVRLLPQFIQSGIDSIKVEGRMKSHLYAGTISKIYREALDRLGDGVKVTESDWSYWESELDKIVHRDYSTGSLQEPAGSDSIYSERPDDEREYSVVGIVLESIVDKFTLLEVRAPFSPGETLEIIPFRGRTLKIKPERIRTVDNKAVEKTKPGTIVKIPWVEGAIRLNMVRKKVVQ